LRIAVTELGEEIGYNNPFSFSERTKKNTPYKKKQHGVQARGVIGYS
jgi:hypothetical protein